MSGNHQELKRVNRLKSAGCKLQIEMDTPILMLTALKFNDRINQRDIEGLSELMTDDHTFIDNEGNVTKGKAAMKEAWRDFFKSYPDYRNEFTNVMVQDNIVVIIGYSRCSYKPLEGPNIWTAKIQDGRVSEWKVLWLNQR